MRIARSISELRTLLPVHRRTPLWLIPTMGALHEGHGSLVDLARAEGGFAAVSIFVNPLQFGPGEDLARYPRPLEQDLAFLSDRGADLVFCPSPGELVPRPAGLSVSSGKVGALYCGKFRPGHFDGVLTVVLKLLTLFRPDRAIFGEKDRQQLFLISSMVRDLNIPVTVSGAPTVREPDGLAMSSRNRYLSPEERALASRFPALLDLAASRWTGSKVRGPREIRAMRESLTQELAGLGFRVDYVAFVSPTTFLPLEEASSTDRALLLAAVGLGTTRLIDNRDLAPPGAAGV